MTYPQAPASPGTSQAASRMALDVADDQNGGALKTVFGMFNFQYNPGATLADNSDFDSGGYGSDAVFQMKPTINASFRSKLYNGVMDAGQAALERAALADPGDPARLIEVRWYDRYGRGQAKRGFAEVEWNPQGGGAADEDTVQIVLHIQGKPTTEANPAGAPAAVPTIASMTPAGKGALDLVTIIGTGFTDATAVDMDSKSADFTIISGSMIIAVVPSGVTTGAAGVVVTNGTGPSAAFSYTFA